MSKHKLSPTLQRLGIVLRAQRIMRCYYLCDDCPNEWTDELLVAGPSWCPCSDAAIEPYSVEEFVEERPEFDLPEIE